MSQQSLNIKSLKEHIYNYGLNIDGLKLNDNALKWFDKERLRIENLTQYERELYKLNYKAIGGVDEVGRGPLAGPVVAGCVVLPKDVFIPDINDSKKLREEKENYCQKLLKEMPSLME